MKNLPSSVQLPVAIFIASIALIGCGSESGAANDSAPPAKQGDGGQDGSGDAPGMAKPSPAPTPVIDKRTPFEFSYQGMKEPVKAKVDRGGAIEISVWPKLMSPTLVLPRKVDFAQVTDEFCAGIEASARAGRRDLVRGWNSFVASVEVMPFATIDFSNRAKRNALAALGGVGAPVIENQPTLTLIRTRVVLSEGAISEILGEPSTLEAIFTKVPVSLAFGTWNGEITATDLLCDLRAGQAKIVFEAETDVPTYSPTSEVSGLGGPT